MAIEARSYEFEEQQLVVRIPKWSTGKLFSLMEKLAEVIENVSLRQGLSGGGQRGSGMAEALLIAEICRSEARVIALIQESVVLSNDKIPTDDEILEWDPADTLGLVDKILELNLTEKVKKKAMKLLQRMQGAQPDPPQNRSRR